MRRTHLAVGFVLVGALPWALASLRVPPASSAEPPPIVSELDRYGRLDHPESLIARAGALALLPTPLPALAVTDARAADVVFAPVAQVASVVVVGGTPAGVAAAIAAARQGAPVLLLAQTSALGGVLTDAMMDQWDVNRTADGVPLSSDLFREMYTRLGDAFAPADAARELDAMVAEQPGIRVVRDAVPVGVGGAASRTGRRIERLTYTDLATNEQTTVPVGTLVDATDDATVATLAGARFDLGRQDTGIDERMQSVTLMVRLDGVDWGRLRAGYSREAYGPGGVSARRAWGYAQLARRSRHLDASAVVADLNLGRLPDGTVTMNAVDVCGVDGLDPASRARGEAIAIRETAGLMAFLRAELPGFRHARVRNFASSLYVRETRHVAGLARLTATDVWLGRVPADTIALSSYPIDLHPVLPSDRPAFATRRHVYGIPFGTLVPRGLANVVVASPAISATHVAAGSARVVPTTVDEGEAAGIAAADAVLGGDDIATIATSPARVAALRAELGGVGRAVTRRLAASPDAGTLAALPPRFAAVAWRYRFP